VLQDERQSNKLVLQSGDGESMIKSDNDNDAKKSKLPDPGHGTIVGPSILFDLAYTTTTIKYATIYNIYTVYLHVVANTFKSSHLHNR
jgi:hypothetical protein